MQEKRAKELTWNISWKIDVFDLFYTIGIGQTVPCLSLIRYLPIIQRLQEVTTHPHITACNFFQAFSYSGSCSVFWYTILGYWLRSRTVRYNDSFLWRFARKKRAKEGSSGPDAVELWIDLQLLEAKEEGGVMALQQRLLDMGQPLRQPVPWIGTTNHIKEIQRWNSWTSI